MGQAYERIKQAILSKELPPGEIVTQDEVAERIGIGRTPVREAIRKLEEQGLCRMIPKRGIMISQLSLRDLQEIIELRVLLEGFTARRASQGMSDSQLRELEALHGRITEAANRGDANTVFDLDRTFHHLIDLASGNRHIAEVLLRLRDQSDVRRMQILSTTIPGRLQQSISEHRALLDAIQNKNGHLTEKLAVRHVQGFFEIVIATISGEHTTKEAYQ